MEPNKLGIKETKEVLKFVIEFGEAIDKGLADGKLNALDIGLVINPLMQLGPALEGLGQVDDELKDLSAEELAELKAYVETELDISNDKVEMMIEEGLGMAVKLYKFIGLFSKKEDEAAAEPQA